MDSNTQVNEDYKFRLAYVADLIKDIFSSSGEIKDKKLDERIEKVKKEQDSKHLANLEKDVENYNREDKELGAIIGESKNEQDNIHITNIENNNNLVKAKIKPKSKKVIQYNGKEIGE